MHIYDIHQILEMVFHQIELVATKKFEKCYTKIYHNKFFFVKFSNFHTRYKYPMPIYANQQILEMILSLISRLTRTILLMIARKRHWTSSKKFDRKSGFFFYFNRNSKETNFIARFIRWWTNALRQRSRNLKIDIYINAFSQFIKSELNS